MNNYTERYIKAFNTIISEIDTNKIIKLSQNFLKVAKIKSKIIIVGNGGSASIASHVTTDLSKVCKIRAINFNEGNFLTCFSNDFGYQNWVVEALKIHADKKDLIVLISSSGTSLNIVNAAKYLKKLKFNFITLNGFDKNNPLLKKYGDINFSVKSSNFNLIENTHQFILLTALDFILEAKF